MNTPDSTFEPRRFRTTVPYYARFRLSYPPQLISRVIERLGLKPGDSVLDLGCGPGLLSIPFAAAGMNVTGVDPEPEMLAAARAAAREADVKADFVEGSSFAMPVGIGPFQLVTMGRAFHWMDREATLQLLDTLIAPGGAIAFFDDDHPRTAENAWHRAMADLANLYGREKSPHVQRRERAGYRTRESVLFRSPFSHIESLGVFVRRTITADDIVGLALSLSVSSEELLGERRVQFEKELRERLAAISPDGTFTEIAEMGAQIAQRP